MSENLREYNRIAKRRERMRKAGLAENELPELPMRSVGAPKKGKFKRAPYKAELYAENGKLKSENIELHERLSAVVREEWAVKQEKAFEVFNSIMKPRFGSLLTGVKLEHVDEAGYWFTFELTNDDRRQTYCIYHREVA